MVALLGNHLFIPFIYYKKSKQSIINNLFRKESVYILLAFIFSGMQLLHSFSLKPYNTFGIDATAKYFAEIQSANDLQELMLSNEYKSNSLFILGGGSNILLTQNADALVIKNNLKGISVVKETETEVFIKANAGEVWHEFVMWCIERNFAGIENLSLIPGCVGASPMQNIGAYGVEIKDVFYELEAIHLKTGEKKIVTKSDCHFGSAKVFLSTSIKINLLSLQLLFNYLKYLSFISNTELLSKSSKT